MKKKLDLEAIVRILQEVLPPNRGPFALHEPVFGENDQAYIKKCLDDGWVSYAGPYVEAFEERLTRYTGARYAVAVVNGTAALHTCLRLIGVSPGDEVLIPALTFVATANAVSYCGAIPHLVDSEEKSLGLDPVKLGDYLREIGQLSSESLINKQSGRPIKAVIPVHTFGHPVDMDTLVEVCRRFRLELIEDAAESLGSYYKGRHTGSWGRVSALSFNGNKIITTGGGGAIITSNENLARLARHLTTQAKIPHPWLFNHDLVGYNYRMPSINAALGCAQLKRLPEFIKRKRALAGRYQKAFTGVEGVKVFQEPDYGCSNYWLNILLLDEEYSHQRDDLVRLTHRCGILTRPAWTLMHRLPMYQNCPRMDLSTAENLAGRIVCLPSSTFLGEEH